MTDAQFEELIANLRALVAAVSLGAAALWVLAIPMAWRLGVWIQHRRGRGGGG